MDLPLLHERMQVVRGDITTLKVDAIVNAANSSLLGGGGVDGAIHQAAGPQLREECEALGGCPVGEARITGGHELEARLVIHTVGPVYGGDGSRAELLASCYSSSIALARAHYVRTIAFPCISTGAYGYPPTDAAIIAVQTVRAELDLAKLPEIVIFCCFGEEDETHYHELLRG